MWGAWRRAAALQRVAKTTGVRKVAARCAITTPSGALMPEPSRTPLGILGLLGAVVPGLLLGAAISKNIANFLEENELFVPSDDDDDDD